MILGKKKSKEIENINKYILLLPKNINKFIILTYELLEEVFSKGIIKDYIIYSIYDSINKYNDYKSAGINDVFDFGFKYINNETIQVVVCNLITGYLYFRIDKINKYNNSLKIWNKKNIIINKNNKEFTYYQWFKTI